jgi:hypothetical protein
MFVAAVELWPPPQLSAVSTTHSVAHSAAAENPRLPPNPIMRTDIYLTAVLPAAVKFLRSLRSHFNATGDPLEQAFL